MKNIRIIFGLIMATTGSLFAQDANDELQTSLELSQGYRRDKLDLTFEVPYKGVSSDIKTKLKNIDVYSSHLNAKVTKGDYFLKGSIGYGSIYDGKYHTESHVNDHISHKKHFERHGHIHDTYTADFVAHFGKNFAFENGWSLAPSIGYGVYLQKLSLSKGHFHEHHKEKNPLSGTRHNKSSGKGLKESYKAFWYSPQFGLALQKTITSALNGFINYSFLFPLNFQGKTTVHTNDKHRRTSEQENKAYQSFGHVATAGLEWKFARAWSLKPEVELFKFYSKGGDVGHGLQFKKADRTTYEARLTLGYAF